MDTTHVIVSALSGLLGATLPIAAKFFMQYFSLKHKADQDQMELLFKAAKDERDKTFAQTACIMKDLQQQIFDMRQQVLQLQQDNISCAKENAELRARIIVLTEENSELRKRIGGLEIELANIRANVPFSPLPTTKQQ